MHEPYQFTEDNYNVNKGNIPYVEYSKHTLCSNDNSTTLQDTTEHDTGRKVDDSSSDHTCNTQSFIVPTSVELPSSEPESEPSQTTSANIYTKLLDPVQLHDTVYQSGCANFQGAKIQVPSTMNIDMWDKCLYDYDDKIIVQFLKYGWPISYTKLELPQTVTQTHKSALFYYDHVDKYISTELSYDALVGPFDHNPFSIPLATSPLSSVPKKDSLERRTVMDLSFPLGTSVNDGIPSDSYLGDSFKLQYPAIDNLIALINEKGPSCYLYKVDIKRCYRWIPVDPHDYHLLGLTWRDKLYFDTKIPFGIRTGAMAAQRTTNALMHIYRKSGYDGVNYIDDIGSAETKSRAENGYKHLVEVTEKLGFPVAKEKCSSPSTKMIFLGKMFDTVNQTVSIPETKMDEIRHNLEKTMLKKTITRRKLESLIGQLAYIADCIRSARLFISSLLDLLRTVHKKGHHINLNKEAKKDILWFQKFMDIFNGKTTIPDHKWCYPDEVLATDATLQGIGGICFLESNAQVFHCSVPQYYVGHHIGVIELLAILVGLRLWSKHFSNKRILIQCDNLSSVILVNTGRSRDKLMLSIARNIWMTCAHNNIQLKASHIPGTENRTPDLLSRWDTTKSAEQKLHEQIRVPYKFVPVQDETFNLDIEL